MNTTKHWVWQPPAETLESITTLLRRRWAAAKKQQPSLFSQDSGKWLVKPIVAVVDYHLTMGGKLIK